MNNNYKVGIYLRLSDEDKNKYDNILSESIINQRKMLLDYINCHENYCLVDEYCDENFSGAGTYRPEFERLINDCELGKINIVLCKSQSRFSRDMEIVEKYLHNKFIEWNVRFISLADAADTFNPGNKKSRQINGLVNEWYLEDVSNNIRSALQTKMKHGEYISPFSPYGYKIDKNNTNKLIIDESVSFVVKDIFNMYLNGFSLKGICDELNCKKIPSPSFYKYQNNIKLNINSNKSRDSILWNTNSIKNILTNEIYVGNLVQGKRSTISYKNHKIIKKDKSKWFRSNNTHDAIIDYETFCKVQSELERRKKIKKNSNFIHTFSGKVFCKRCSCLMKKKNSSKYIYLYCNIHGSIRYDLLEEVVLGEINNRLCEYYDEDKALEYLKIDGFFKLDYDIHRMIDNINNKIIKIYDNSKRLYEDMLDDVISKNQFKYINDNYNKSLVLYKNEISLLEDKLKNNSCFNISDVFDKENGFYKLNRLIINEFIDKIYVDKNEILLKWDI